MTEAVAPRMPTRARSPAAVLGWLRRNLFSSWLNSLTTLVILWALLQILPGLIEWLALDAVWGDQPAEACRAEGAGACWAFVHEKARLILFGIFPYDEQWRPLVATLIGLALIAAGTVRRLWGPGLALAWAAGLPAIGVLMAGGVAGLSPVPSTLWGGLPLTLGLSVIGLAAAFPLGILLALGRRSPLPVIRLLSTAYIELIRGVPFITILFMASVLLPLFLPPGVTIDKLLRAQIGIILFAAAYIAEAVRGGLQAIPRGQYEAADSLGLGYWRKTRLIILPQALTIAIPPLVNTFISFFKDTSLVVIIGLFDLLGAAKTALTDRAWSGFYIEAYLFVAVIYFLFCFTMSRYSQHLERAAAVGQPRR